MDIKAKIGLRIKGLRKQHSISQESLANKVGLDRTYINGVENGRRNITVESLEKIANGFNMGIYEFFNTDSFKGE